MVNKINNYLGICKKAGYLIIGSDNLQDYHQKLYLIIVNGEKTSTITKLIKRKMEEYENVMCIIAKEPFSQAIGLQNCKIVGVKNKGITEEILKLQNEYILWN